MITDCRLQIEDCRVRALLRWGEGWIGRPDVEYLLGSLMGRKRHELYGEEWRRTQKLKSSEAQDLKGSRTPIQLPDPPENEAQTLKDPVTGTLLSCSRGVCSGSRA